MAPIRRPNSRVQAIGTIQDVLDRDAPTDDVGVRSSANIRQVIFICVVWSSEK
jgi:hypothetical protein